MDLFRFLLKKIGWKGIAKKAVEAAGDAVYDKADEVRQGVEGAIDEKRRAREDKERAENEAREAAAAQERKVRAEAEAARAIDDELAALKKRVDEE